MRQNLLRRLPSDLLTTAVDRFRKSVETLARFPQGARLGLAVSGGPDSMALAVLAKAWAREHKIGISAAVVDHGLRSESADEAKATVHCLQNLGIDAQVLEWTPAFPISSRKMELARLGRYRLLTEWAREKGLTRIWLGHHADDQKETQALRHQAGSGVDGRRGMDQVRFDADLRFERPLMSWSKAELVALLEALEIPYVLDPSNSDLRSMRGRLRQAKALPISNRISRNDPQTKAASFVAHPLGHLWMRRSEIDARSAANAVAWVRGGYYSPSLENTAQALAHLETKDRVSLFGCVLEHRSDGWTLFARESRRRKIIHAKEEESGLLRVDDRWIVERSGGTWSFDSASLALDHEGLPQRALDAWPKFDGKVARREGSRLIWDENSAIFDPKRPLYPEIDETYCP